MYTRPLTHLAGHQRCRIAIGKLALENSLNQLEELLTELEIERLQISFKDAEQYLALLLHHRDPFDRRLIAQAMTNSFAIVNADPAFEADDVQRLWA